MEQWIWTVKQYFTPKAPVKTPLPEQWIFFYRGQKEAEIDKQTALYPQEKPEEKESNPE